MLPDVGSMPPGNESPMCNNPFDDGTVLIRRGHRGNGGRSQIAQLIAKCADIKTGIGYDVANMFED